MATSHKKLHTATETLMVFHHHTYTQIYTPPSLLHPLYRCASHSSERDKNSFLACRFPGFRFSATRSNYTQPLKPSRYSMITHKYKYIPLSAWSIPYTDVTVTRERETKTVFPFFLRFSVFGFWPPATKHYTQPLKPSWYSIITHTRKYRPLPACYIPYTDVLVTRARETK